MSRTHYLAQCVNTCEELYYLAGSEGPPRHDVTKILKRNITTATERAPTRGRSTYM